MKRAALAALAAAAVSACASPAEARVGCRDMDGNPVDWFMAYKIPKVDSGPSFYQQGLGFAYMDSNSGGQLTESSKDLTSTSMALSYTLNQVYESNDNSELAFVKWNDETPDEKGSQSRGHSKGVLAYDSESGFYFSHSVPRWPNYQSGGYDFPDRECTYGQDFICLSLATADFEGMAAQLRLIYPLVYESRLPDSLAASSPNMAMVIAGQHLAGEPYTAVHPIMTLGGASFTSMAKNAAWASDIYEDLVARQLDDDLRTETWQNGRGKMASYCKPAKDHNVENIEEIEISADAQWKSTKDHAKIAISSSKTGYVCLGDENRQTSQAKRGGGTICSNDPNVYKAYSSIIDKVESC